MSCQNIIICFCLNIGEVLNSLIFLETRKHFQLVPESLKKLWNNWELRVLVLVSLTLQLFLFHFGRQRRYNVKTWIHIFLWFCYLVADSVATVALGVISNKQQNCGNDSKLHNELAAFWAPFMLLHLGGQDTITAYAIQDNELWLRHLLSLVAQSCVATYIFNTSLRGHWLSLLTIPMLVAGFIRYAERIWVMRSANRPPVDVDITAYQITSDPFVTFGKFRDLFLYQKMPNALRDGIFEEFRNYDFQMAFKRIEIELGHAYDYFYTKTPLFYRRRWGRFWVWHWSWGCIFRCITCCFIVCVFVVFIVKERHKHLQVELIITYILLGGAVVIEISAVILQITSTECRPLGKLKPFFSVFSSNDKLWSNTMGQFNMLSFCSKNPGISLLGTPKFRLGRWFFSCVLPKLDRELEMLFYKRNKQVSDKLKSLVWEMILGKSRSVSPVFSEDYNHVYLSLEKRIPVEIDESIIIWHLATELCFYTDKIDVNAEVDNRHLIRKISHYMMYILAFCPSLLSVGTAKVNFQSSCRHIRYSLEELQCIGSPMSNVLEKVTSGLSQHMISQGSPVGDDFEAYEYLSKTDLLACADLVAQKLREREDRWEIFTNFWVENLAHVATLCQGNSHAQQLRKGGEFLTHVWFLIEHMDLKEKFRLPLGGPEIYLL